MSEPAADPAQSSSARRRYLALTDDGWRLTTPPPPADYRLLHSWPRGYGRRLDLEFQDDGQQWRLTIVGWCGMDTVVGLGEADLLAALGYYLPLPRHSLAEAFA